MPRGPVSMVVVLTAAALAVLAPDTAAEPVALAADAYTEAAAPDARHGSKLFLRVSESTTAFLRFDLSAVPAGSTVASATLSVHVARLGTPGTVAFHAAQATWTEDELSHGRRPAWETVPIATLEVSDSTSLTDYVRIDVTAAVQAWLGGTPNHGLAVVGTGGVEVDLMSKEYMPDGRPPLLDVIAVPPPPAQ